MLGPEDAPGLGGELGGEELLVRVAGGEVLEEAVAELGEVGFAFEGEEGEFGGESVFDGVEAGVEFAGGGAGAGGVLGVALVGESLFVGDGSGHALMVAWGWLVWAGLIGLVFALSLFV